ncbi:MAG: sulfotransferase [Lentisphaeria bacterium]|nr:sulfotransferase [Lentisphaeria bacterium]
MRGLCRNLRRKAALGLQYLDSALHSGAHAQVFEGVRTFCLFLGYPRSGHSLVGSLMDAHPDMIFAHEANALKAIRYGFSRDQLFYWLVRNSEAFTRGGRSYTGYTYEVPGQWQGRCRNLRVIGDKYGNFTVEILVRQPGLYAKARARVGVPIRFVHVIRNPFDNIATIFRREKYDLQGAVDYYFALVDDVMRFAATLAPGDLLEVHHEDLIERPAETIRSWCRFLEVEPDEEYVQACASIVFDSPHRSRLDVDWTPEVLADVTRRKDACAFLRPYTFEDSPRSGG